MNFAEWHPVYRAILAAFGYDRGADERARDWLAEHARPFDLDRLRPPGTVAVAGAGPSLEAEADRAADADRVFAASTAADRLSDRGVGIDLLVTDLDKNPERAVERTLRGWPVAVHAHGDNRRALREYVPRCDPDHLLPTTQAEPTAVVGNFGGFTDGDRAAFLADHLGADRLAFLGWDFDDPAVGAEKHRKLQWAARLLYWLERRRDERFAVLDGRRAGIDAGALPVD